MTHAHAAKAACNMTAPTCNTHTLSHTLSTPYSRHRSALTAFFNNTHTS